MARKKWTRARVVHAIRMRQRHGLPLSTVWKEDHALYAAAKQEFGSWQKALLALGVPDARPLRRWSKERVIKAIQARQRQGCLATTWKDDLNLYGAGQRRFGSWPEALVAAGVRVVRAKRRKWSRPVVLEAIRARQRQGRPLKAIRADDARLYSAAQRYFGGWYAAVRAAGLTLPPSRTWNRERVIREIQSRHQQGLSFAHVVKDDPGLVGAAQRYFGNWSQALVAAGLTARRRRKWTRPRLIQAIQEWYPQGQPKADVWTEDPGLASTARRYFGSWHAALRAAGIEPQLRLWSAERVLQALRIWRQGAPQAGVSIEDPGLASAAAKHFGSCRNAFLAAGLEAWQRGWSKEQVIEAIQNRHVQGLPLISSGAPVDTKLVSIANRRFGTWRNALVAAGFDHLIAPPRIRWTRERILAEIQRWHEQGSPLSGLRKQNPSLARAACREFGGWGKSLVAAGVEEDR